MGKIYNVILNSVNATNYSTSATNNLNYYIDWLAVLPNKPLKLTWSYFSGINFISGFKFPYLTFSFDGVNYTTGSTGAPSTLIIGSLKPNMLVNTLEYGCYYASINDNAPIHLIQPPINNNFNVSIYANTDNRLFYDEFYSVAGSGNATQAGYILTVTASTTGQINIGSTLNLVVPLAGQVTQALFTLNIQSIVGGNILRIGSVIAITGNSAVTITGFVTGAGGTGTYTVNVSQNIISNTNFTTNYAYSNQIFGFLSGTGGTGTYSTSIPITYTASTPYTYLAVNGSQPAPYMLTLSFEELDD